MRKFWQTILSPHVVMFGAVMVVVTVTYIMSRSSTHAAIRSEVNGNVSRTEKAVQERLDLFEETLRAGVGLFAGDSDVTKEDWSQFVKTSAVLKRYPGAQGLGYVKVVRKNELPSFMLLANSKMAADYKIFPEGDRDEYAPVAYFQSSADAVSAAVGFDMYTEQKRFNAMSAARDSGEVFITDSLQLLSNTEPNGDPGFVMYSPQYKVGIPLENVEQRRAAIDGYIYAVFRTNTFMQNISIRDRNLAIAYAVYSKDSGMELF